MTKQIPITKGKYVLVDDEDFDFINQWKWQYTNSGYALRRFGINKKIFTWQMHMIINQTPPEMETDHINGDKLDNRKANLRTVTRGQNNINRPSYKNSTSKYKGVYWGKREKKWKAQICHNKINRSLGSFLSEKDAAMAYNKAACALHGNLVRLNILP